MPLPNNALGINDGRIRIRHSVASSGATIAGYVYVDCLATTLKPKQTAWKYEELKTACGTMVCLPKNLPMREIDVEMIYTEGETANFGTIDDVYCGIIYESYINKYPIYFQWWKQDPFSWALPQWDTQPWQQTFISSAAEPIIDYNSEGKLVLPFTIITPEIRKF